ncbi:MAG: phage holin family protein [Actinobacteria bacterium]|nr:phage holin family protein [Actinomycetota bacterium]
MSDPTIDLSGGSGAAAAGGSVRTGAPPARASADVDDDRSLGELVSSLLDDTRTLVQQEIQLAKVEIKDEVRKASKGGGLVGAGAFAGSMAILLISFAAAWGLAAVMPDGLAFLIVGLIWGIAAAVLAMQGKKKLQAVHGPEQTKATLQEDVQWAKNQRS